MCIVRLPFITSGFQYFIICSNCIIIIIVTSIIAIIIAIIIITSESRDRFLIKLYWRTCMKQHIGDWSELYHMRVVTYAVHRKPGTQMFPHDGSMFSNTFSQEA